MEKELVKQKIRELSRKIKEAGEEEWEWMPFELEIVRLIIDYSIEHKIEIPLIDYARYKALSDPPMEEDDISFKSQKRKKIDQPGDEGDTGYNYLDDFSEAIAEKHFTNPRFTLHPDIQELVDCWDTFYEI